MTRIAIVTGSVRPGRQSRLVADWVKAQADTRGDADYEVLDIADYDLPLWQETTFPVMGQPAGASAQAWSQAVAGCDGFVFVVAEYNHSVTGALKNALDYLNKELNNKAAGFVSYGSMGGARAVEHLRGILSELQVAHVRHHVAMPMALEFPRFQFTPSQISVDSVQAMLNQLLPWTRAMAAVRAGQFQ
jgi:NAD(P)H-dependent FMN reductase